MPYIAIKGYPRDAATKIRLAEKINEAVLEVWGCGQESVNLSFEEIAPDQWDDVVTDGWLKRDRDKMMILNGKKLWQAKAADPVEW